MTPLESARLNERLGRTLYSRAARQEQPTREIERSGEEGKNRTGNTIRDCGQEQASRNVRLRPARCVQEDDAEKTETEKNDEQHLTLASGIAILQYSRQVHSGFLRSINAENRIETADRSDRTQ